MTMVTRFARWTVAIEPGGSRADDPVEWRDALVVVRAGSLEIVGACGVRLTLPRGAVLWLAEIARRELRNPGNDTTVVVALSRPRT